MPPHPIKFQLCDELMKIIIIIVCTSTLAQIKCLTQEKKWKKNVATPKIKIWLFNSSILIDNSKEKDLLMSRPTYEFPLLLK